MSTSDEDRNRLLSPEEIAALANADYDADEDNAAALAEIGRGNPEDDDGASGGDEEGKGKHESEREGPKEDGTPAPKVDAGKPHEDTPAEPKEVLKPDEAAATEGSPAATALAGGYKVELPKDYDDQVKANKEAITDLRKKFDDGEVDAAEYHSKLDDLQDQRYDLREMKTRATVSAEMQQQSAQDAWVNAISAFVADAGSKPELGIVDYTKDAEKQADLDAFVKVLASAKGNESKPMRWFLEQAHKRVVALYGIPTTAVKKAPPTRTPDVKDVVTNLADVPGGADEGDPASNEFAELDKLSGLEYEQAMGALRRDPAKYNRYLLAS